MLIDLGKIWDRQAKFNSNFMPLGSMTQEQKEQWTKDFILYIQGELIELAQNLSWKTHRKENVKLIESNIQEEIIDAFKYLHGIMLIWNMSPEDFQREWLRKTEVVEQRFQQEFSKPWDPNKYSYCAVIDIDGVLADYVGGLCRFINHRTGVELPPYDGYDLYTHIGKIVGFEKAYDLKHQFRDSGQKAYLEVIPGSQIFMNGLRDQNAYILLMSARPYKKYKRIMADTIEWLKKNLIPYDSILWDEDKEDRIIKEYPFAAFVVEDSYDNAIKIASKGIPVYLRNTSYNQGSVNGFPITRFKEYMEIIPKIARRHGNG